MARCAGGVQARFEQGERCDRLQLCAQALCLEEMLGADVPIGFLYYGETRSREKVEFDESLCALVGSMVEEMHALYRRVILHG